MTKKRKKGIASSKKVYFEHIETALVYVLLLTVHFEDEHEVYFDADFFLS